MDLGAYANINELNKVAIDNGIHVPRLRGYRLMKDEDMLYVTPDDMDTISSEICEDLCCSVPFWKENAGGSCYCRRTDRIRKYYLERGNSREWPKRVRWDRIHGWKRKVLKTAIHNKIAKFKKQYDVWNKYVGRDDVLYIHARIGGGNWQYYYKEVVGQPWFLEKVDDAYDSTYCDIYAKIREE